MSDESGSKMEMANLEVMNFSMKPLMAPPKSNKKNRSMVVYVATKGKSDAANSTGNSQRNGDKESKFSDKMVNVVQMCLPSSVSEHLFKNGKAKVVLERKPTVSIADHQATMKAKTMSNVTETHSKQTPVCDNKHVPKQISVSDITCAPKVYHSLHDVSSKSKDTEDSSLISFLRHELSACSSTDDSSSKFQTDCVSRTNDTDQCRCDEKTCANDDWAFGDQDRINFSIGESNNETSSTNISMQNSNKLNELAAFGDGFVVSQKSTISSFSLFSHLLDRPSEKNGNADMTSTTGSRVNVTTMQFDLDYDTDVQSSDFNEVFDEDLCMASTVSQAAESKVCVYTVKFKSVADQLADAHRKAQTLVAKEAFSNVLDESSGEMGWFRELITEAKPLLTNSLMAAPLLHPATRSTTISIPTQSESKQAPPDNLIAQDITQSLISEIFDPEQMSEIHVSVRLPGAFSPPTPNTGCNYNVDITTSVIVNLATVIKTEGGDDNCETPRSFPSSEIFVQEPPFSVMETINSEISSSDEIHNHRSLSDCSKSISKKESLMSADAEPPSTRTVIESCNKKNQFSSPAKRNHMTRCQSLPNLPSLSKIVLHRRSYSHSPEREKIEITTCRSSISTSSCLLDERSVARNRSSSFNGEVSTVTQDLSDESYYSLLDVMTQRLGFIKRSLQTNVCSCCGFVERHVTTKVCQKNRPNAYVSRFRQF